MTPEDILKMAQEIWGTDKWTDAQAERLERFAALVAVAEREACAKVCLEQSARWHTDQRDVYVAHECAAAIRARGQA